MQGSFARRWPRGAPAQPHAEPTKSIDRFGKICLLPSHENIPVVITAKLHLPNLDNVCFLLTKNSWWQLYLHEDMLQDSKVNFSIQGLFTKCCHIVNWFPLDPLFVMGLIVFVYDHSKRSHRVFAEAINNLNLKKAELTYPWLVPVWVWPSEESKWLPWEGSFQRWDKIKLFNQHKGAGGTKLR